LITLAATSVAHAKAEAARSAVALYEETADKANLAESLRYLADGLRQKRELQEAEVVVRRSLALFEELGRKGVSKYTAALDMCAGIVFQQGRIEEGRDLYAQVLARYEKVGDVGRRTRILTKVADLELQAGNPQAALALVEPAIEILAQLGDVVSQTLATCNKAAYLLTAGRVQDAHVAATEAVNLAVFVDNTPFLEFALQHVAVAASLRGNVRLGARLLNHVDGWFAAVGLKREYTEQRLYEAGVRAIRAALSRSEADALLQSAEPLSTEDAVALALSSAAAGGAVNASA
jgi:tetratricopeptide (TPR) repeat protein